ncbi:hypothetical protein BDBG_04355 [Blastomyces gilchristii SLH14081]|uniref:Uncharacterized protein n=1 Tax=Blastomyces gilchristii (strain SLH14081) TaxID=559298 RepID=A0A179UK92_BLAGS|nr:uncharacterized protein BDBG_04355 [Blastomyces gilchristii SLH14081]OAT08404.1 hypothetical protein BDBG_04355 [Blastomyces gilchristii SLH14081]
MASSTFTGIIESRIDSLNIPILKFSYSTTSADRASPLGWTHLSSSGDLAVIFDHILPHETSSSFSQGDQHLRVLRGSDLLEQLNLNSLAREAAAGSSHSLMQTAKSPVAIIVKSPCLAVRYPMRNDQTRRFQIKFPSDADYSHAVSVLSQLGCPITHSAAVPPHQASSNRPFSSSSQTPSLLQVGKGEHTMSPAISNRPTVDQHRVLPWSPSLTEPSTSGSCISSFNNNSTNPSSSEEARGRPHTSALSIPQTGTPGITTARLHNLATDVPSATLFHPMHRHMSPLSSNSAGTRQTSDWSSKERPAAAPVMPDVESLSLILPPKRELPFAKPGRKAGSKQPSRSRPPSGKQASKPTQSCGSSSSIFISQSRASTSNTTNENPPSVTKQGGGEATITTEAVNSSYANPNPRFRRHLPQEILLPDTHNVGSKSIDIAVAESSTLFANSVSLAYPNDGNNASSTKSLTTAAISANPQASAERAVGGLIPLTSRENISEISQSDLSAYLSTPNSERTALVESWVCSQLESDAFLALCQDVEGVWGRIAFGY